MTREEIHDLAALARLELSEAEVVQFTKELSAILSYVGAVQELVGDATPTEPMVGDRYNVFRQDIVSNEPDGDTAVLLKEMPATNGRFLQVKKILHID
jgi:aspartyl-tRNA(Asn)/glutamyl-tRNA(Gln) amidotransferase subunit C